MSMSRIVVEPKSKQELEALMVFLKQLGIAAQSFDEEDFLDWKLAQIM